MLEVKNLVKEYKTKGGVVTKALDDVSIVFPETGMIFLLGKSGSGKSTLLNVIGGLDRPDKGETFQGHIYDIAAKIYCLNHKNELEKRLGQKLNFNSASDLDNNVIFQYVFLKEKPANQNLIVTPEHEAEAITTLRKIISAIMEYNVDCDVNKTLENMNKGLGVVSEYTHSDCEYCQYSKHCRYKIENGENVYPKSL